jgi:hypothetical protein
MEAIAERLQNLKTSADYFGTRSGVRKLSSFPLQEAQLLPTTHAPLHSAGCCGLPRISYMLPPPRHSCKAHLARHANSGSSSCATLCNDISTCCAACAPAPHALQAG